MADDRDLEGKISRRNFLKLIFAASSAITLLPLIQLTRIYAPIVSDAEVIDRYRVGEVDKYGILKLYPTKPGGLEWFANWNAKRTLTGSNMFDPQDSRFGVTTGTPIILGDGIAHIGARDSSPRLYVKGPWLNTEQTVYVKVRKNITSIQLRGRVNHHGVQALPYGKANVGADDDTSCGFGGYMVKWCETGMNDKVRAQVEIMHGFYRRDLAMKPFTIPLNKWVGYKLITLTLPNGYVQVTGYNDMNANNTWTKTTEWIFDGKNAPVSQSVIDSDDKQKRIAYCKGKGDKIADNINANQIFNKPGYWNNIRVNNPEDVDFRWYSVREIQP